jgi:outer membrane protein OmpA-like peptidoglycan-associated protein
MKRIRAAAVLLLAGSGLSPQRLAAQQETEIPGVTARLVELRQYNGVLRLGISLKNSAEKLASSAKPLEFSKVMLVDAQSKQKHFAMKDADGHYLAGPVQDWNDGGRWYAKIPPGGEASVWVLFEPLSSATKISVQVPLMFPFDDVQISEGPPGSSQQVAGTIPPLTARLVSAKRSEGQLKIQIKVSNAGRTTSTAAGLRYADAFVFEPKSQKKYPLLKDSENIFLAQPISDRNEGGRWFLSSVRPGTDALMSLVFPAPPDSVQQVDVVIPGFIPFEAVSFSGTGGSSAAGVEVAGKTLGLEGALKELNAEVTPQEIKINLGADVLFDFDKADLKSSAEPSLDKVVTVLKAYPTAQVEIDGHTDRKGNASYNQGLSERRASSVANWLSARSGLSVGNFHRKGWGATQPVAPNTKPDGSDNPEGRQKNRRVEIVVTKSS